MTIRNAICSCFFHFALIHAERVESIEDSPLMQATHLSELNVGVYEVTAEEGTPLIYAKKPITDEHHHRSLYRKVEEAAVGRDRKSQHYGRALVEEAAEEATHAAAPVTYAQEDAKFAAPVTYAQEAAKHAVPVTYAEEDAKFAAPVTYAQEDAKEKHRYLTAHEVAAEEAAEDKSIGKGYKMPTWSRFRPVYLPPVKPYQYYANTGGIVHVAAEEGAEEAAKRAAPVTYAEEDAKHAARVTYAQEDAKEQVAGMGRAKKLTKEERAQLDKEHRQWEKETEKNLNDFGEGVREALHSAVDRPKKLLEEADEDWTAHDFSLAEQSDQEDAAPVTYAEEGAKNEHLVAAAEEGAKDEHVFAVAEESAQEQVAGMHSSAHMPHRQTAEEKRKEEEFRGWIHELR